MGRGKGHKDAPESKKVPGTPFLVDAFRYKGAPIYFLTHFHGDHYQGLSATWTEGIVVCSCDTALLVHAELGLPKNRIAPIDLLSSINIGNVKVTAFDANHCPGSACFVFQVFETKERPSFDDYAAKVHAHLDESAEEQGREWFPLSALAFREETERRKPASTTTKVYVHTGDMRYCQEMTTDIRRIIGDEGLIDTLFLDTTYAQSERFDFPPQEKAINFIAQKVIEELATEGTLIVIGSYVVGKERIFERIVEATGEKLVVDERKMRILQILLHGNNTSDSRGVRSKAGDLFIREEEASEARIRVVKWDVIGETWPFFRPNFVNLRGLLSACPKYTRVVGFVPTGWMMSAKESRLLPKGAFPHAVRDDAEGRCRVYLVPYSEHSSFSELREFIKELRPKRIVPTVYSDEAAYYRIVKKFNFLTDQTVGKRQFLSMLSAKSPHDLPFQSPPPEKALERVTPSSTEVTMSQNNVIVTSKEQQSCPMQKEESEKSIVSVTTARVEVCPVCSRKLPMEKPDEHVLTCLALADSDSGQSKKQRIDVSPRKAKTTEGKTQTSIVTFFGRKRA